jgi:type II secretory pathway pseudopilin PulG
MNAHHHHRSNWPSHWNRPRNALGFTITELLVVIGIIILLAGILLVALGRVRNTAMRTTTTGTMQAFSQACDAFQTEHQQYPGVIPESILARAIAENQVTVNASGPVVGTEPSYTSTENALLHLMGGYRVVSPADGPLSTAEQQYIDFVAAATSAGAPLYEFTFFANEPNEWRLAVNLRQIGEGPVINRQQYGPYFTPGANVLGNAAGQWTIDGDPDGQVNPVQLPDLLDAWGQPILYFRQVRDSGPLTAAANDPDTRAQFYLEGALAYLNSPALGERSESQIYSSTSTEYSGPRGSVLSSAGGLAEQLRLGNFAQILRHPSFGVWDGSPLAGTNLRQARARGAYALFSAGPDGIYFSAADGPGRPTQPVTDLTDPDYNNPQSVEEYDDIRIFGGG